MVSSSSMQWSAGSTMVLFAEASCLMRNASLFSRNLAIRSENLGPTAFNSSGNAAKASLLTDDLKSQQLSPNGINNYLVQTCLKDLCCVKSLTSCTFTNL